MELKFFIDDKEVFSIMALYQCPRINERVIHKEVSYKVTSVNYNYQGMYIIITLEK